MHVVSSSQVLPRHCTMWECPLQSVVHSVMQRMHVVCHARFCQVTAQCDCVWCTMWECLVHNVRVPGAQCESAWCKMWECLVHTVRMPGLQCESARCTTWYIILQAGQVLPGHRAAALLQHFLPLVCHLASVFCSNVHFQMIFSQISISSPHFPTRTLFSYWQFPSVAKCFKKQALSL